MAREDFDPGDTELELALLTNIYKQKQNRLAQIPILWSEEFARVKTRSNLRRGWARDALDVMSGRGVGKGGRGSGTHLCGVARSLQ